MTEQTQRTRGRCDGALHRRSGLSPFWGSHRAAAAATTRSDNPADHRRIRRTSGNQRLWFSYFQTLRVSRCS